ncbi:CASP-like protein 1F2 [Diospyros lotus]|uniref:CASP-like protein 1F2 n=1 Tax=Diospyros lotus TaxID=55363 RepID=UPI00224DB8F3|nr:CASP-like protein 1F2 [Diospyros lotus]
MASKTTSSDRNSFSSFKIGTPVMSCQALHGPFEVVQVVLRLLAVVLSAAAIAIMLKSRQSILIFGIEFDARYNYSSAFKFLVGVDVAACFCSVLSLILVLLSSSSESKKTNYFSVFLHDLVITLLVMAGCAAATAIGMVGQYGQNASGWMPICDRVGKFCHKATASVALSFTVLFCYLALTVTSVCKLKSSPTPTAVNLQETTPF